MGPYFMLGKLCARYEFCPDAHKKGRGLLNYELQIFKAKKIPSLWGPNLSFYGAKKTLLQTECFLTLNLKSSKMFHVQ